MAAIVTAGKLTNALQSLDEQREFFLWKFKEVSRDEVNQMLTDFKRFDFGQKCELEENEALMLLEYRGTVKTARELREMIKEMDKDKNHRISFVEWCCAWFQKSWEDLNDFADEDARDRALAAAREAAEAANKAEQEMERIRLERELAAQERAKKLEEESKLTGVAGMKAFFARKVEGAQDVTKTNQQQILEEAAKRRELRDAKHKMNEAIKIAKTQRRLSAVVRDVQTAAQIRAAIEAEELKKKIEDEKAERAARKAAFNSKWSGPSNITRSSSSTDK